MSSHSVYFAGNPSISSLDRITLSTTDVTSTESGTLMPPILAVGIFPDDAGRRAVTVFLA